MMLQAIAFYVFSAVLIGAAFMVIAARNPVHSVLFLILAFFSAAGLFVLLGAEFIAMILVVVYVGAVAVLFLFVVMMLDIDFVELRQGFLQYLPTGAVIGLIVLGELLLVASVAFVTPETADLVAFPIPSVDVRTNTGALGDILYTNYFFLFQAAGIILLIAMIGAIVLTLRVREGVKKQNVSDQVNRRRKDCVEKVTVRPGQGI